jgi:ATP-dependent Clp protease ATP-binding subunit ClpA
MPEPRTGQNAYRFREGYHRQSSIIKEVERIFLPEFRNRLDEIVLFNHINEGMALLIAKKAVRQFEEKLSSKNISLKVTDECYNWIAGKGLSSVYGAREIFRVVQDKIKTYFVDEVCSQAFNGGSVWLIIRDGNIYITVE